MPLNFSIIAKVWSPLERMSKVNFKGLQSKVNQLVLRKIYNLCYWQKLFICFALLNLICYDQIKMSKLLKWSHNKINKSNWIFLRTIKLWLHNQNKHIITCWTNYNSLLVMICYIRSHCNVLHMTMPWPNSEFDMWLKIMISVALTKLLCCVLGI